MEGSRSLKGGRMIKVWIVIIMLCVANLYLAWSLNQTNETMAVLSKTTKEYVIANNKNIKGIVSIIAQLAKEGENRDENK
jgi:hypothetical protein